MEIEFLLFSSCDQTSVRLCPPLFALFNGRSEMSSNLPGQTCRFSCDKGYRLKGSATRTCRDNGTWSGAETQCNGKVTEKEKPFSNVLEEKINESIKWIASRKEQKHQDKGITILGKSNASDNRQISRSSRYIGDIFERYFHWDDI